VCADHPDSAGDLGVALWTNGQERLDRRHCER
jgi:hypothetical protein